MARDSNSSSELTYRYDALRAPFDGMLESAWVSLSLLIAVRYYDAPASLKALLASAGFVGLLFNTLALSASHLMRPRLSVAAAACQFAAGVLLVCTLISSTLIAFVTFMFLARFLWVQTVPFLAQLYSENYSANERGRRLSTYAILVSLGGVIFALLSGELLEQDIATFPLLLAALAGAAFVNGWMLLKVPSPRLPDSMSANPLEHLGIVLKDKLFAWMLGSWMLLGFGNLITVPIRIEYLANPDYGINLSNDEVLMLTFIVPTALRILSARGWGILFDRMNFVWWRILVNTCFIASYLLFFNFTSPVMLYLGMIFAGLAMGGGMLGWQLWVTKIAPPEKVSGYMSVHSFFTGVRGAVAPWVGYPIALALGPGILSGFSSALVLTAAFVIAFCAGHPRLRIVRE